MYLCVCMYRQTIYSECHNFHPNRFTSGRVIAECVNTVKTRHKVNPILGEAIDSRRVTRKTRRLYCVEWTQCTAVFSQCGPLYATKGVSLGPPESSAQTTSRSLQLFLQGSLGDRPTDRPTDHATRSVKIGGAHSGKAKFCYCLRLQQVTTSIYWSSRLKYTMPAFTS